MVNALIMAGHVRTFKDIAEEVKNFVEQNNLDVYFFAWDENNQEEINYVVETLKPVKWLVEPNSKYAQQFIEAEKRIHEKNPKQLITPDKVANTLSMHFGRRTAYDLIEKDYDNYIFTRFDTHIFPFLLNETVKNHSDTVITPTNEQYGMVSDIFAIIPSKYSDNFFFYPRTEDILSRRFSPEYKDWLREKFWWENKERDIRLHDENRYCPHQLCMRNFYETNTPYIAIDLPVYIKR